MNCTWVLLKWHKVKRPKTPFFQSIKNKSLFVGCPMEIKMSFANIPIAHTQIWASPHKPKQYENKLKDQILVETEHWRSNRFHATLNTCKKLSNAQIFTRVCSPYYKAQARHHLRGLGHLGVLPKQRKKLWSP